MKLSVIDGVVPVTKQSFQAVMERPEQFFEMMHLDFREIAQMTLSSMLRQELTAFLGRESRCHQPTSPELRLFRPESSARVLCNRELQAMQQLIRQLLRLF